MRLLPVLLLAFPLLAQSPELSVQIHAPARVPLGHAVTYSIPYLTAPGAVLEIDLPGTLLDGSGAPGVRCETGSRPIRCTFTDDAQRIASIVLMVQLGPGTYTATARISHGSTVKTASVTTEVVPLPALTIDTAAVGGFVSPRQAVTIPFTISNRSTVPATNVRLTVTFPAGGTIAGVTADTLGEPPTCVHDAASVNCTIPRLVLGTPVYFSVRGVAPARVEGSPFSVNVRADADEDDFDPGGDDRTFFYQLKRELLVTNTNDSGDGSLRTAMLDAHLCVRRTPCNISFQIPGPVPLGGKFVIQPRTPLPELAGELRVDGVTQTAFTGDTNPDGPEIEIDGSRLAEGAGIRLSPNCAGEIYDLAITNFPGHGIDVRRMPGDPAPEPCVVTGAPTIHVKIARNHLTGNLRGIGLRAYRSTIEQNVIRGNRRSGIFAGDGTYLTIRGNHIESNGASGVFVNVDEARLQQNVIADNEHWALARTARGNVIATANSMIGNRGQAIDVGLDLETPANRPVLFWAIYDPARRATVVRGRFDGVNLPAYTRISLEVFASSALSRDSEPQAERAVLEAEIERGQTEFELVIAEDLRGKWITAVSHVFELSFLARAPRVEAHSNGWSGDTSELSNAVFVAP